MLLPALLAVPLCAVVAYAGVGDVVNAACKGIVEFFSGVLLSLCDALMTPVSRITTMTVDELCAFIPGFSTTSGDGAYLAGMINGLAVLLLVVHVSCSIYKYYFNMLSEKKTESPYAMVQRFLVFGSLAIFGQRFLSVIFNGAVVPITREFSRELQGISFADIASNATTNENDLVSMLVGAILVVMIAQALISLVLEAAERYLICIVTILLSPLSFSCGVSEEYQQVAKNWIKMFWSHCILLILNMWVIRIAQSCFMAPGMYEDVVVWGIVTYAYLKVAQKLDNMLQNSGLMITRTGGDFMRDALVAVGTLGKAVKTGADAVKTGADAVKSGGEMVGSFRINPGSPDFMKPIQQFQAKHPVAGVAATPLAYGIGKGVSFGQGLAAEKQVMDSNDSRLSAKNLNLNSAPYHKAAENQLKKLGFDNGLGTKGGPKVESLMMNPDGSMTGILNQRDENGNVVASKQFSLSNAGNGMSASLESDMKVGMNGKSVELSNNLGRFQLAQVGTDMKGNAVWSAKQTHLANGTPVTASDGKQQPITFTFKPNNQAGSDGLAAQAATAFTATGVMQNMADTNSGAVEQSQKTATATKAALNDLYKVSSEDRAKQIASSDNTENFSSLAYKNAVAQYMQQNGLDNGMVARGGEVISQQVAADGRLNGVLARKDENGNVVEEQVFSLSTPGGLTPPVSEAQEMADNAAEGAVSIAGNAVESNSGSSVLEGSNAEAVMSGNTDADVSRPDNAVEFAAAAPDAVATSESEMPGVASNAPGEYAEQAGDSSEQVAMSAMDNTVLPGEENMSVEQSSPAPADMEVGSAMASRDASADIGAQMTAFDSGTDSTEQTVVSGADAPVASAPDAGKTVEFAPAPTESAEQTMVSSQPVASGDVSGDAVQNSGDAVQNVSQDSPAEVTANTPAALHEVAQTSQADASNGDTIVKASSHDADTGIQFAPASVDGAGQGVAPSSTPDAGSGQTVQTVSQAPVVETVMSCTYKVTDEGSGFMQSSQLGDLQINRISVDNETGDTKWQIIKKDAEGNMTEPVTIERKGKKGKAETFFDVVKDIRKVKHFDEIGLADYRQSRNLTDDHLFD